MDLDAVFAICCRTGCALQCTKSFVVPSVGGATRYAKFAAPIFQNAKKSAAVLCQILRMVTIDIVINYTRVMGIRVTISCRYCIAFEVMLLVSSNICNDKLLLGRRQLVVSSNSTARRSRLLSIDANTGASSCIERSHAKSHSLSTALLSDSIVETRRET